MDQLNIFILLELINNFLINIVVIETFLPLSMLNYFLCKKLYLFIFWVYYRLFLKVLCIVFVFVNVDQIVDMCFLQSVISFQDYGNL